MEKGNSTALELMKNNTDKNTWKELQNAINKKNKPVAFINKNYLMMTKMKQKSRHASIQPTNMVNHFNNESYQLIAQKFK